MAINLRYVGKELHQALKVRAATEDVTIESLCVRFLWQGLEFMASGDSTRVDLGSQPEPAPIFGTEPQGLLGRDVAIPSAIIKTGNGSRERPATDMQALRDICAGKLPERFSETYSGPYAPLPTREDVQRLIEKSVEIPICGKQWWEDGEHYECLMDAGHREQKHGMRGMVRRVD